MLSALREMHEAMFVHRDVKPDNFMVHKGQVKIVDFGLTAQFIKQGKHIVH